MTNIILSDVRLKTFSLKLERSEHVTHLLCLTVLPTCTAEQRWGTSCIAFSSICMKSSMVWAAETMGIYIPRVLEANVYNQSVLNVDFI